MNENFWKILELNSHPNTPKWGKRRGKGRVEKIINLIYFFIFYSHSYLIFKVKNVINLIIYVLNLYSPS